MPNIFIYGSCVSRDTQPFLGPDWRISDYVARQSFISAASDPVEIWGESLLTSKFQNRSLVGDFESDFLSRFRRHILDVDVLVIDLVDERLGVYRTPTGRYITRSWEFTQSGLESLAPYDLVLVDFGSDEHFALWSFAARKILGAVRATPVLPVVLAPAWSAKADNGGGGFDYQGFPAEVWNAKYGRYVDFLEGLGHVVVRVPPERSFSSTTHQWGLAPYHYYHRVYETMSAQIRQAHSELAGLHYR